MDDQKKDEVLKVELGQKTSQDFKITTMEDDLKRVTQAKGEGSVKEVGQTNKFVSPEVEMKEDRPPLLQPPEFLLEEKPKTGVMRSFLVGFSVVILVGLVGIGAWWYTQNRLLTSSPPAEPVSPPLAAPALSTPLVSVDRSFTVDLEAGQTRELLFQKLASLVETSKPDLLKGDFARVVLKQGEKFLTPSELGKLLEVEFPSSLSSDQYTLLFFMQEPEPVFALVLKILDSSIQTYLSSRESEAPLLVQRLYGEYAKASLSRQASETFLDNTYQGTAIRYMNFDTPERSFDYAISNDLLLLAGSRQAMFMLIDRAKLQEVVNDGREGVEQ
ncbi:MAG: hypothetical protein HYZ69_00085 [Candidatus Colwellbacteria bacterium]|nr:hypothetical protein [Candidatus Colwellbacteria bacterium]